LTHWIIIRCAQSKEAYVTRQIALMGFDAWVPVQHVYSKPAVARRVTSQKALVKYRELPVLPKCLFAAVPMGRHGDLQSIRYFDRIERDTASCALQIPDVQIRLFRDTVDRMNAEALAYNAVVTRKTKAKWVNLKEAMLARIEQAKTEMEIAA
jgi:hypothetical protein